MGKKRHCCWRRSGALVTSLIFCWGQLAPAVHAYDSLRPGATNQSVGTYDALIGSVKEEWLSPIRAVVPDVITRLNARTKSATYTPFPARLRELFPDGVPSSLPQTLQRDLDAYVQSGLLKTATVTSTGPYQLTLSVTYRRLLQDPAVEGPLLNFLWQRTQEAAALQPPEPISSPLRQLMATAAQRAQAEDRPLRESWEEVVGEHQPRGPTPVLPAGGGLTTSVDVIQPPATAQRFLNAFKPKVSPQHIPNRELAGFRRQDDTEDQRLTVPLAAMAAPTQPPGPERGATTPGPQDAKIVDVLQRIGLPSTTPWATVQSEWRIERLHHVLPNISAAGWTDSRTGAPITRDFFGNYPAWVYELRHEPTLTTIYVGPDDIETLFHDFPDRLNEKETFRKEKEALLTRIRERLRQLQRLQALLGIRPEDATWRWPTSRPRYLGDQDVVDIDAAAQQLEAIWRSRVPGLSLDEGIEVLTKLEEVLRTFGPRRGRTTILTDSEMDRLQVLLAQLQTNTAFTAADRDFLLQLHQLLLLRQTRLQEEARDWGRGRPIAYDPEHERKTPAYHANLEIAAWLVEQQQAHPDWRPFILDAGANISVLYRILRELSQASGLETNLAGDVVDLEADPAIYAAAINPQRILADLTQLPATQAATDESVQELAEVPHQFGVVVASFVLDQLAPEQIPQALAAFEHLLVEPHDATSAPLQQETITDFPLLILASPEHSPLRDSPLDQVLQGAAGYTLIRQATLTHQLTSSARQRLLKEEGREVLTLMEQMTGKPFHLAIYAKTAAADLTAIRAIKPEEWRLRRGRGGGGGGGGGTTRPTTVNVQHLLVLDLLPTLQPNDFQTHTSAIVARQTMLNDPAYADFEERLAALINGRHYLSRTDQQRLETVLTLWDRQYAAFLSDEQARFIMGAPDASRTLVYQQVVERYPHLRPQLQQRYRDAIRTERDRQNDLILRDLGRFGRWGGTQDRMLGSRMETFERELNAHFLNLWELYQEEEHFRREHPERRLPSLATQLRSRYSIRVRGIREAADTLRKDGKKIDAASIARLLGISKQALLDWAKHNNENVLSLANVGDPNEKRLEAIRGIVASFPETATRSFVANQLDITPKYLSNWARDNGYKLSDLGIIPESQVRAQTRVVEAEEKQAQPRTFSKLPDVVAYIERLFEEDQNRRALPSEQAIGEAIGARYTTIGYWMPDILRVLQASKNPRVVQALRYQETTSPSRKTRAEEIADYLQGLFENDPARTTFPPPGDIARAFNISPSRISENMRGALQRLRNSQDPRILQAVEVWESSSRSGRRSAFDPTRIVEYIRQLFRVEPNRTTLPQQRQFGNALGMSHGAVTSHMSDILEALRATGDVRIIKAVELWEQHSKVRQLPPPQIGKQMQVLGVIEQEERHVLRVVSPTTPDQIVELPLTSVDVELPAIIETLRRTLRPEEAGSLQSFMDTLATFLRSPPMPLPQVASFGTLLADLHGYASAQPAVIALYERLLHHQDPQLRALAIFHELGESLVQTQQLTLALEHTTNDQPVLTVILNGHPFVIPLTRPDALAIAQKGLPSEGTGSARPEDTAEGEAASNASVGRGNLGFPSEGSPHYLLRALQRQAFGQVDERLTQLIKQHQQELTDQIAQVEDRRARPQVRGNGWLRVSATDAQAKRFHQTFVSMATGTYTAMLGHRHVNIPAVVWAKMARWFGESPELERLGSFVMTQQPDGSWHAIDFIPMASYAVDPESALEGSHPADVMQVTVPVGYGRVGFPVEVEQAMGLADPTGGIPLVPGTGGPVTIVLAHSHSRGSALGDWPTREDRYAVRDVLAGFVYNMTSRQGRFFTTDQLSEPSRRQRATPSEETVQVAPPTLEVVQAYQVQIGQRVTRLREIRGLGITELAQQVGIARSTLGRMERGQLDSSIAIWFRLAVALGMPVELLLDDEADGVVLEPSVSETQSVSAERIQDFLTTIGDRLRRTRLGQRDSQDDVATRGGVGRRSVSSAEHGQELPIGTWLRLAAGVGLPMRALMAETSVQTIYTRLYRAFGPQHWWPAESAFEVMVGAILVQATSWASAEQTIARLREANALTPQRLAAMPLAELEELLRSSNYFRQKAARLQLFSQWFLERYEGDVAAMFATPTQQLREELLALRGIGPETADSMLLYAGQHPVFVAGVYTQRVLRRHGLIGERAKSADVQRLAREELPVDAQVYNEAHALLVKVGQEFCHGCNPDCATCPLGELPHTIEEGAVRQPTPLTRLTHSVGAAAEGERMNRRESLTAQLQQFLPELLKPLPDHERAHLLRMLRRWATENERLWNQVVPEVLRAFSDPDAEQLREILQIQAVVAHNLNVLDSEAFLASGIPLAVEPWDLQPDSPQWRILIAVDGEGRIVAYGASPQALQSVELSEPEVEEVVYLSQGHDQRFYASQWSAGRPVPEGVVETIQAYNARHAALEVYNRQPTEVLQTAPSQPQTFPIDEGPGDEAALRQIVQNNVDYLSEMDLYSDWSMAAHRQLPPEAVTEQESRPAPPEVDLDQVNPTQWRLEVTLNPQGIIVGIDEALDEVPDDAIVVLLTQGERAELMISALLKGSRIPLAFMRSLEMYNALGEQAATQEPPQLPEVDEQEHRQPPEPDLDSHGGTTLEQQNRRLQRGDQPIEEGRVTEAVTSRQQAVAQVNVQGKNHLEQSVIADANFLGTVPLMWTGGAPSPNFQASLNVAGTGPLPAATTSTMAPLASSLEPPAKEISWTQQLQALGIAPEDIAWLNSLGLGEKPPSVKEIVESLGAQISPAFQEELLAWEQWGGLTADTEQPALSPEEALDFIQTLDDPRRRQIIPFHAATFVELPGTVRTYRELQALFAALGEELRAQLTPEQQAAVPPGVWKAVGAIPAVLVIGGEAANMEEAMLFAQPFFEAMTAAHLPLDAEIFLAIVPAIVTSQQLTVILPGALPSSAVGPADWVRTFQADADEPVAGYGFEPASHEDRTITDTRQLLIAALTGLAAATLRHRRATAARTLEDRAAFLLLAVPAVILPSADAALQEWRAVQRSQAVVAVAL